MIVTRHRRRRSHPGRIIVPLLVVIALGGLLALPPVQDKLSSGPLRPFWVSASGAGQALARPLTFAAQQQTITDRNREIRTLDGQLEDQRKVAAAADARIAQLQRQLAAVANQPLPTEMPRPAATPAPVAFGDTGSGDPPTLQSAAQPTEQEKRLAATWAAMEPENAAAVVQRLPDAEVTRVLALMDADAAGAIMDALPPAAAARISRAAAQVSATSDR